MKTTHFVSLTLMCGVHFNVWSAAVMKAKGDIQKNIIKDIQIIIMFLCLKYSF